MFVLKIPVMIKLGLPGQIIGNRYAFTRLEKYRIRMDGSYLISQLVHVRIWLLLWPALSVFFHARGIDIVDTEVLEDLADLREV